MRPNIRLLYFYLFSFVGLLITVIGCIRLVDLGMKVFIFPDADNMSYYAPKPADNPGTQLTPEQRIEDEARQKEENEKQRTRQRQLDVTGSLSMIIVGFPLYIYHWKTLQKEHRESREV